MKVRTGRRQRSFAATWWLIWPSRVSSAQKKHLRRAAWEAPRRPAHLRPPEEAGQHDGKGGRDDVVAECLGPEATPQPGLELRKAAENVVLAEEGGRKGTLSAACTELHIEHEGHPSAAARARRSDVVNSRAPISKQQGSYSSISPVCMKKLRLSDASRAPSSSRGAAP